MASEINNEHPELSMHLYKASEAAAFCRTRDAYGGCSNMAGGFPIQVYERGTQELITVVGSSEALYQCGRFPKDISVQHLILSQRSAMAAKMVMKPFITQSRPDWEEVRVPWMDWCVRQKLASNRTFADVLRETKDLPIVEKSRRDRFWGAVPDGKGNLEGSNQLGKLLTSLREELPTLSPTKCRMPCPVPGMKLLGRLL